MSVVPSFLVSIAATAPSPPVDYHLTIWDGLACGDDAAELNNNLSVLPQTFNGITMLTSGVMCAADEDWFVFYMGGAKDQAVLFTVSWLDGEYPVEAALGLGCGTAELCFPIDLGPRDGVVCCAEAPTVGETHCLRVLADPTTVGIVGETTYDLELSEDGSCPF